MPTLFRFLMTLAILAGIVYGAMVALVLYVKPVETDMTYRVPAETVNPKPKTPPLSTDQAAPATGTQDDAATR